MREPNRGTIRAPAVAGRFYPADAGQCRTEAQSFLRARSDTLENHRRWIGGIVPHAGWVCSGAIGGETIATLAHRFTSECASPDVVIVFGAIHTPLIIDFAALDSHALWDLPGDRAPLAVELSSKLQERGNLFAVDDRFHTREHAVEVNLPMIRLAFPNAQVIPLEVPAIDAAELIGRKTAQTLHSSNVRAVYLASSDFTHYGVSYGFAPVGVGEHAMRFAKENDRRLLDRIERFDLDGVLPEVRERYNACGAGAIVAMLAASREAGASAARVLTHANSYETLARIDPQPPTHAVGYASVVVG